MAQWDISNISTLLLSTQTDADSPVSQFTMDKIRLMLEQLLLLTYDQGSTEGSVASLTTGTNTVITCAASSYGTDDFNGMTLLVTTGLAKGNMYTIDDVSTSTGGGSKLTLTGDNAYADGARANDTYKILYDQLSNADGHDHDGKNSRYLTVQRMFAYPDEIDHTTTGYNIKTLWYVYRTADMDTLHFKYDARCYGAGTPSHDLEVSFGGASTTISSTNIGSWSTKTGSLDISGEPSTWGYIQLRMRNSSAGSTFSIRRFGGYVE